MQGPGRCHRPGRVPRRATSVRGRAWSPRRGQRPAAVVAVCYFREGPSCILKRGLRFSLAFPRDPGTTAAPQGLLQAWATSPAWGCLPGPGSAGLEPPGAPGAGNKGAPPSLAWMLHFATRAAKTDHVWPLGSVGPPGVGSLVTCTLRWTFGLRTFLSDTVGGSTPHLRRAASQEDTRRRLHRGCEGAVLVFVAGTEIKTHCPPAQDSSPAPRTPLKFMPRPTTRASIWQEPGCCPWSLSASLESSPPG